MKTTHLVLVLVFAGKSLACDICGGVHANSSIGLFAANRFHTLGLSTQYRSYQSFDNGQLHSKEVFLFNSLQLRYQLGSQIQLYGQLPYQMGWQYLEEEKSLKTGFGDAQGFINLIGLQQQDSSGITQKFISVALGVKAPTGQYVSPSNLQQNLYPGTGAWNYTLLLNGFKLLNKKWSLQSEMSHTWKGKNNYAFQYGNSSQLAALLVLNEKFQSYRFLGSLGFQVDHFAANHWDWQALAPEARHEGTLLQTKMSCNLLTYNWLYSLQAIMPIWQNINSGTLKFRPQIQFTIQYLIQQKK
jgi:hypothetical protein